MPGHGLKMDRKKEQAIAALLSRRSVEEAAGAVGVNPKTLRRWMRNPEFNNAFQQARHETYFQVVNRLQQSIFPAVNTMCKIMLDQNASEANRLRAANCILSQGTKAMEMEDLEARVAELERGAKTPESDWTH